MSKKIQKGITLTELLVAVVMVGFMMMGIVALDYAMKRTHTTTADDAELSMRMAAAMTHISNTAVLATGNRLNKGIDTREPFGKTTGASSDRVYIRKAVGDPASYDDDQWVYYWYNNATAKELMFCPNSTGPTVIPPTAPAADCVGGAPSEYLIIMATEATFKFLANETTLNLFLEVTIKSRYNVDDDANAITNRELSSTTRIIPVQHTW